MDSLLSPLGSVLICVGGPPSATASRLTCWCGVALTTRARLRPARLNSVPPGSDDRLRLTEAVSKANRCACTVDTDARPHANAHTSADLKEFPVMAQLSLQPRFAQRCTTSRVGNHQCIGRLLACLCQRALEQIRDTQGHDPTAHVLMVGPTRDAQHADDVPPLTLRRLAAGTEPLSSASTTGRSAATRSDSLIHRGRARDLGARSPLAARRPWDGRSAARRTRDPVHAATRRDARARGPAARPRQRWPTIRRLDAGGAKPARRE